jgi:ribosomal protein S18 acetylase RimI-like enzyme
VGISTIGLNEMRGAGVSQVLVEPLDSATTPGAVRVLARAFVTNPLHVAAFGRDRLDRNETFFRIGLSVMRGRRFVAIDRSGIVGVVHWVESPRCQFSMLEKLRVMPAMIAGLGVDSALELVAWLDAWSKCDPKEPHSHFGPIGVDPSAQGRAIGRMLMTHYCEALDREGHAAYLETDRPENVAYYARFGFRNIAEQRVLGVPNFFMWRARR